MKKLKINLPLKCYPQRKKILSRKYAFQRFIIRKRLQGSFQDYPKRKVRCSLLWRERTSPTRNRIRRRKFFPPVSFIIYPPRFVSLRHTRLCRTNETFFVLFRSLLEVNSSLHTTSLFIALATCMRYIIPFLLDSAKLTRIHYRLQFLLYDYDYAKISSWNWESNGQATAKLSWNSNINNRR